MGRRSNASSCCARTPGVGAVSHSARMVQGYLLRGDKSAVRVRIMDDVAELNIATRWTASIGSVRVRDTGHDAREILEHVALRPMIDKTRHHVGWRPSMGDRRVPRRQ